MKQVDEITEQDRGIHKEDVLKRWVWIQRPVNWKIFANRISDVKIRIWRKPGLCGRSYVFSGQQIEKNFGGAVFWSGDDASFVPVLQNQASASMTQRISKDPFKIAKKGPEKASES